MPIRRMRRVPISRLSPSTALTGASGEEIISSAELALSKYSERAARIMQNIMRYGVYMCDNFLPIGGLSIYF